MSPTPTCSWRRSRRPRVRSRGRATTRGDGFDHRCGVRSVGSVGATDPSVVPGSPADKAGLKDGDIITSVDGQKITALAPLDDILTEYVPGTTVALDVLRDGKSITLTLTLGTRPANL